MGIEIGYIVSILLGMLMFGVFTIFYHKFLKYRANNKLLLFTILGIVLEILICLIVYLLFGINFWTNSIVTITFGLYAGYIYNAYSNKRHRKINSGNDGVTEF